MKPPNWHYDIACRYSLREAAGMLRVPPEKVVAMRRELGLPEGWDELTAPHVRVRVCLTCGKIFTCEPSDRKITCSRGCSSLRKTASHLGVSNKWGKRGRENAAKAAKRTRNYEAATEAAKAAYETNPEAYHEAKEWIVIDPEGNRHHVINLSHWLRLQLGEDQGRKVYAGLKQVARSMRGKTKRPVRQSHGWTLGPEMLCASNKIEEHPDEAENEEADHDPEK